MVVQKKNPVTKKLEEKQIMPASILEHHFADCHSFDLSVHSKGLRRVDVNSNWSVNVMFHHKKQKKIHGQLSVLIQTEG